MADFSEFVNLRRRFISIQEQQQQEDEQSVCSEESVDVKSSAGVNRHSVFWIVASLSVSYYVDFFRVVLNSSDIHSLNVALWPVWSFFTPVILFTQFMGVVMLISLLG
ncbi:Transmembrane protein 128 [Triplophysa tibetana]|uniref:Transmembrane protein 128 n=1 Tax=Triplophysa tibetana TaxID=1572043 RepID=A0A5A9NK64_9TELE|nr:Transmembrane protein 128 [Triplophysa tibetana]